MKNRKGFSLVFVLGLTGCGFGQQVGDYVTEKTKESIERQIDESLARKHLSIAEIISAIGPVTSHTTTELTTTAKDFLTLEAKSLVDQKLAESQAKIEKATKEAADANSTIAEKLAAQGEKFWNWLISGFLLLISGYLTKQVVSAKMDGKRDARISVLEKLMQKDLDGDGKVG